MRSLEGTRQERWGDIKQSLQMCTGEQEGKRKNGTGKLFKEIMAEMFHLIKDKNFTDSRCSISTELDGYKEDEHHAQISKSQRRLNLRVTREMH